MNRYTIIDILDIDTLQKCDQYEHILGKECMTYPDIFEVGNTLVILLKDRVIRTTEVQHISDKNKEVCIITKNRKYILRRI